ncbi:Tryptophan synthase alpha chain [Labilithrix luteola]|uniref:Tryptophan synthase alpha chain n=1 Tax=Labilithrix luteola TaxID=1391654 RepID=A0A0K1Q8V9_9BACT|nr:SUMF1/EgtB/PvdO family nonheme iron enzyme [Labilithrix luteola]AKV02174.1 Tryptophan synthase alpha chain [Labilithrix luteola]
MGKCVVAKSCVGTPGADNSCGDGTEGCCESIAVPGGAYVGLDIDGKTPIKASVSPFKLDKFEITVGRLRAFYNAHHGELRGNPPAPGAGANPHVAGSGWRSSFDVRLTGSWSEINERHVAACSVGGDNNDYGAAVWTADAGPNEDKPINCVDWYTLFAFCIWDGGRLPTDAEWGYVGQSGDENRVYPYGDEAPTWLGLHDAIVSDLTDPPSTSYKFTYGPLYRGPSDGAAPIAPVGLKSERSRFGHADLTGNVIEMTADMATSRPSTCNDCGFVAWPDPPQGPPVQPPKWQKLDASGQPVGDEFGEERAAQDGIRLARGSSWQGEWGGHHMKNGPNRFWLPVWRTYSAAGGRCARD